MAHVCPPYNLLLNFRVITFDFLQFRAKLLDLNLGVVLPVGTSDAGSLVTTTLAEGSDFIQANVHPLCVFPDSSRPCDRRANSKDTASEAWKFMMLQSGLGFIFMKMVQ